MKYVKIASLLVGIGLSMMHGNAQTDSQKIVVYSDDFMGAQIALGIGRYDNLALVRNGIATVKSLKVPRGMKVTLYQRGQFDGPSIELTEDASQRYLESRGYAQTIQSVSLIIEFAESPTTSGPFAIIYRDDFAGGSKNLAPGQYEFNDLGNVGNDQLSSLRIPPGMKVTLYEHGGFEGRKMELTKDTPAALLVNNKFNDLTSSIKVEMIAPTIPVIAPAPTPTVTRPRPRIEAPPVVPAVVVAAVVLNEPAEPIIYEGDFSGASKSLSTGRFSNDQLGIGSNQLSSVKVPRGFRLTLYDGDAFEGRSITVTSDARATFFVDNNFNNLTSSILVEHVPMVTVYDGDYSGMSKSFEPGKYDVLELGIANDQLSSVRVPRGLRVTLFENSDFSGRSLPLIQDSGSDIIADQSFNNITSSIIVEIIEKSLPEVFVFSDDFGGLSEKLTVGKYTLAQLDIGDNIISSIRIPRGLEVTLYENDRYSGRQLTLRGDANMNLLTSQDFNDITSSIDIKQVFAPDLSVTLYTDRFSGLSQSFTPGRYLLKEMGMADNQVSAVKVPSGMRVVMYEDDNFRGYSLTAERDIDLSVSKTFDDRTSSIMVEDVFTPTATSLVSIPVIVPAEVVKQPVVIPTAPPCEMTSPQFQNAFGAVKAKPFDSDKLEVAKISTKARCLSLQQIREMTGLFMSDDLALDFVKYAYDHTNEKQEYYLLENSFKFMSTKEAFIKFVKAK